MADNFDVRQFLFENKLGAYSRLKENNMSEDEPQTHFYITGLTNDKKNQQIKDIAAKAGLNIEMKIINPEEDVRITLGNNFKMKDAEKMARILDRLDTEWQDTIGLGFSMHESAGDLDFKIAADSTFRKINGQCYRISDKGEKTKVSHTYCREDVRETEEGYMGTQYDSSEDMAVDMVKKGITEREVIYVVRDGRCYRKDDEGNMDEVNMSYCKRFAEGKEEVEEAVSVKSVQKAEMSLQNLLRNIATNANIPTDEKEGLINALGELQDFVDEVGYDSEMEDEYVSDYSRRRASELKEDEHKDPIKEGGDVFADIDDDIAYGSDSKEDAIEYLEEIIDYCQKKIVELENEQGYEDEENDLDEAMGGKNPEGDKLVLRFLQGIANKFNYPVAQAAVFVKNTIKSLGY